MPLQVQIKKQLGAFLLDVSFESDREILALLGASGCGKSMTLKCIAGVETPDEGRVVLNGRTLFDSRRRINLSPQKRRVGYLFQQYALFPHMTVEQNISTALRRLDKGSRRQALDKQIAMMRLEGLEKRRPSQLSGGQQQRVALARMLASEPELLLLDEPFTALDSYLKWQLELEMMETLRDFGGDVLFVSHSRDEVYRLCQTVCVLTDGRSEPKETMETLFHAPATLSAALLSGCKNISRIRRIDSHRAECLDWGTVLSVAAEIPADAAYAGIRAHFIKFATGETQNVISCRVKQVVQDVFSTILMLDTPAGGGGAQLRMEMPKESWTAAGEPEEVRVWVAPEAVMSLKV